jgi:ribonuclease HII
LVAAGVLLDPHNISRSDRLALARLDDSKKRSAAERERLYPAVLRAATATAVSVRSVAEIDDEGVHKANLAALADCIRSLDRPEATLLVDGFSLPACELEHEAVIKGDSRSAAIAAASVVAKVTRDRFMQHADRIHPGWGFAGHAGYSSQAHRDAIAEIGISPLHRRSFASVAYSQLELDSAA